MQLTAGAGLVPDQLAVKPKVTVALGAMLPFHVMFLADTAVAFCVTVAFQACVIRCPLPKLNVAVHDDVDAVVPLRTVTSPWKPSPHWFTTR